MFCTKQLHRQLMAGLVSQGPRVEGGHASARILSFDGQSAAAAARSGMPIDLMTVAARVDAGEFNMSLTQHRAASWGLVPTASFDEEQLVPV